MEQRQICVVVVSSRYGCFGGNKCCSEHSRDHVLSVMGKPNAWLEAVSSGKMSIPSHKCCILINRALCTAHCLEYLYAHNNSWSCQRWKFSKPVGNSQRKLWNGFDKQSFALFSSFDNAGSSQHEDVYMMYISSEAWIMPGKLYGAVSLNCFSCSIHIIIIMDKKT